MSLQSQTRNMKVLATLLSADLGYIYGERESGPNGEKKHFLSTGRAFLNALGKDLGFAAQKMSTNKAGIAVSGEVTLMGMWRESDGLYVKIRQDDMFDTCILYRSITHIKDYSGGANHYIPLATLRKADYAGLILELLRFREDGHARIAA